MVSHCPAETTNVIGRSSEWETGQKIEVGGDRSTDLVAIDRKTDDKAENPQANVESRSL